MKKLLEPGERLSPGFSGMKLSGDVLVAALTATIFALVGAVPILISMANSANLSARDSASIIMCGLGISGIISIFLSLRFRQPIYVAPSITAVAVIGPMFSRFSLSEMVFGYLIAGFCLFVLGYTGLVGQIGKYLPLPIVLGMVAGVFMHYGINLVLSVKEAPLAGSIVLLAFLAVPTITKKIPPQGAALIAAVGVSLFLLPASSSSGELLPHVYPPSFILPSVNFQVILSVSLPILIMSLADIYKGFGVLRANGYEPPLNTIASLCGITSILCAFGLGHAISLTGPAIAIISGKEAGPANNRYTASVVYSAAAAIIAVLAGMAVAFITFLPVAIVNIICGLAMIGLLTSSLHTAFGGQRFQMGALTAFVVGLSNLSLGGLGAPVWAMVFGLAVSLFMERSHFKR